MELFILRTNLDNKDAVRCISPLLNKLPWVSHWTIDLEDIDKVLRIEATQEARETEIIKLLEDFGIKCASLPE